MNHIEKKPDLEKGALDRGWQRVDRVIIGLLALTLFAGMVIYIWSAVQIIPLKYEFKGWASGGIMHSAGMLAEGRSFYVDFTQQPTTGSCYPPGLHLIVAGLIRVFGLKMWVGRVAAIAGLVFLWGLMHHITFRLTGERKYGLFAIGFLMAGYGVMEGHFDSIHPDSWTIAWGLLTLIMAEASRQRRAWIVGAAVAAACSYFTKQTGVSFAAGATVYLFLHRRSSAVIFAGLTGVLIGLGHLAGDELTDGLFWHYTIRATIDQPIVISHLWEFMPFFFLTFSGGIVVLIFQLIDNPRALRLKSPYPISLPIVFFLYGAGMIRRGGNLSNFYPALVLASILLASVLAELRKKTIPAFPKKAFLILVILLGQSIWLVRVLPATPDQLYRESMLAVEKVVRETDGEVLVFHRISFAFLNDRPIYDSQTSYFDLFMWKDRRRLEDQIRKRFFTRILIPKVSLDLYLIKTSIKDLIEENYYLEMTIPIPNQKKLYPLLVYHRKEGNPRNTK